MSYPNHPGRYGPSGSYYYPPSSTPSGAQPLDRDKYNARRRPASSTPLEPPSPRARPSHFTAALPTRWKPTYPSSDPRYDNTWGQSPSLAAYSQSTGRPLEGRHIPAETLYDSRIAGASHFRQTRARPTRLTTSAEASRKLGSEQQTRQTGRKKTSARPRAHEYVDNTTNAVVKKEKKKKHHSTSIEEGSRPSKTHISSGAQTAATGAAAETTFPKVAGRQSKPDWPHTLITPESNNGWQALPEDRPQILYDAIDDTTMRLHLAEVCQVLKRTTAGVGYAGSEQEQEDATYERDLGDMISLLQGARQDFGNNIVRRVQRYGSKSRQSEFSGINRESARLARDVTGWTIEAIENLWEHLTPTPSKKQTDSEVAESYKQFLDMISLGRLAERRKYKYVLDGLSGSLGVSRSLLQEATFACENLQEVEEDSGFLRHRIERIKSKAQEVYSTWARQRTFYHTDEAKRRFAEKRRQLWEESCEELQDVYDDAKFMSLFRHDMKDLISAVDEDEVPHLETMAYMTDRVLKHALSAEVIKAVEDEDEDEWGILDEFDATVYDLKDLREALQDALSRAESTKAAGTANDSELDYSSGEEYRTDE